MGERSFVNRILPEAPGKTRRMVTLNIDVPLLLGMITLLLFGLLMVYSASWDFSYLVHGSSSYIILRQLLWVVIGIAGAVFLTFFNYQYWKRLAVFALFATMALLALVLAFGETRLGATRAFFSGSIQPSELAKLVTVIYLAVWLTAKRDHLDSWGFGLIPLATILGVVGGLIYLQPDLSAAATVIILGGIMFFLVGGDLRRIVTLLLVAVLVGWIIIQVNPTGSSRVADYMAGLEDPTQASYHVQRSLEAFVKGGIFGVGIGKADTKLTGLPVPPTDSIFAVIGEETGVIGAAFLLSLYVFIMWRSLVIARRASDSFGSLLAGGLGAWLIMEALINMLVIVGLLPFAGNALPFISAGGSNMLVSLAAVGIIMNVSRSSVQAREKVQREPFLNALINLRRGNRRRRVSRPRRPSGSTATQ